MLQQRIMLALLAVLTMGASSQAGLIEILPDSYSFDKATDTGTYQYHDWTGEQLIDGQYGTAPWTADLGNGHAYEWVGWVRDTPVNIDFDFGTQTLINEVHVGSVQDHINDVVLPDVAVLSTSDDGITWSQEASQIVPESSANNNTYYTYMFSGLNFSSRYVRVSLSHNTNGPWTFVDEVDFFQETSATVPEPTSLAIVGFGVLGLAVARVRRRRK